MSLHIYIILLLIQHHLPDVPEKVSETEDYLKLHSITVP